MSKKYIVIAWTDETKSEIQTMNIFHDEMAAIVFSDHLDDSEYYNDMIELEFNRDDGVFDVTDETINVINELIKSIIDNNQEDY